MSASRDTVRDFRSLLASVVRSGRGRALHSFGLSVAHGVVECAGLALLVPILSFVGLEAGPAGKGLVEGFRSVGIATLPAALAVFVLLVAASSLLERAHDLAAARLAVGTALDLRHRLHAALSRSSFPWFSRLRGAAAVHALTEEAERAGSAAQSLLSASAHAVLALVYLVVALAAAPGLAGPAAIGGLLVLLAWFRIREARWWGAEGARTGRDLVAVVGDGLQEARTDRAHGQAEEHVGRFGGFAREAARSRLSLFGHLAGSRALLTTGAAAVLAVFVWISVALLGTAPAALLLSLFLLQRLFHRAVAVVQQVEMAAADLPGFAAVQGMTRAALAAAEEPRAASASAPLRDRIAVEDVSFSWSGPDRPAAVTDASFELAAGSLAVIAGPSGSGKTTLVDLVAGVLAPDRGRILVDGAVPVAGWGGSVGYVAQDALLLHGTVRSNLLRARPSATDAELRAAMDLAGAPGLDRETGDRGQALSGGERRRVALARALLRRPALLVLDGLADGLDPAEEARLLEVLDGLRGRTTILLVSHRETCARRADLVVRMERGRAPRVLREAAA